MTCIHGVPDHITCGLCLDDKPGTGQEWAQRERPKVLCPRCGQMIAEATHAFGCTDFPITLIGDPNHAAKQRETVRRLTRRNRARKFECPAGFPCRSADECPHWDYED